jgi:hypothetical protein
LVVVILQPSPVPVGILVAAILKSPKIPTCRAAFFTGLNRLASPRSRPLQRRKFVYPHRGRGINLSALQKALQPFKSYWSIDERSTCAQPFADMPHSSRNICQRSMQAGTTKRTAAEESFRANSFKREHFRLGARGGIEPTNKPVRTFPSSFWVSRRYWRIRMKAQRRLRFW